MQTTSASVPLPAARRRGSPFTVLATVAGLLAALFLTVGGALLYADHQKDHDGWFSTSSERFTTDTRALATANLDLDLDGLGGPMRASEVRLQVTSAEAGDVFVGIGRTEDVERYLGGTAHATLTDLETSPFRATTEPVAGDRVPADPATQDLWSASASGAGTRTVEWELEEGDWSAVVMNADGSSGVDVRASAGADVSFLQPLGIGLLGVALALSVLCALLIARTVRRPR